MLDAMLYTLLQWNHVETAVEKFCAIFDVVFFILPFILRLLPFLFS